MRLLFLAACICFTSAQLEGWDQYEMVWSDNFDTLDLTKWQHEITAWGGGNFEFQLYSDDPENSYVQDGVLYIQPTLLKDNINPATGQPYGEDFFQNGELNVTALYGRCDNEENNGCYRSGADNNIPPTMSARLRTFERFDFTYGRVRIQAKGPSGDWLWPAMWLLPEDWLYGPWPQSGEMDIYESIGNEDFTVDGVFNGRQRMGSTLHWGPNRANNRWSMTHQSKNNDTSDYSLNWHLYEMEWTENGFRFVVDGDEFANFPTPLINDRPDWQGWYDWGNFDGSSVNPGWESMSSPWDQGFHFIFNVAVGGTVGFIPDSGVNRGGDPLYSKPWSNAQDGTSAANDFRAAEDNWYWTWTKEGLDNTLRVDFIEVYQLIAN